MNSSVSVHVTCCERTNLMLRSLKFLYAAPMLAGALILSACGTTPGERALTGGGIGALGGAAIGGLAGGSAGTGAIIGGVGGAAVGALTAPRRCVERDSYGNCVRWNR
jgi:hypothetical protein